MAIAIVSEMRQIGYDPTTSSAIIGVWFTVFEGAEQAGLMAQVPIGATTTPSQTQMRTLVADTITTLSAQNNFTISTVGGSRQILFQDYSWASV